MALLKAKIQGGIKMNKIILTSKPSFHGYSIEAGKADNKKHFDHHGEFENLPSPCNNFQIRPIKEKEAFIEITHMDADTYCGILRLLGKDLPKVDLTLLEEIDNNGSSVCGNKFNTTLLYMLGIEKLQRDLEFPKVSNIPQDVTSLVEKIIKYNPEEIIATGRKAQDVSEKSYEECKVIAKDNKVLFSINALDNLDPSRAYEDGFEVVVVYREHYKSISIYCNPSSNYAYGGSTVSGILFNGHPKACGSPRGEEMSLEQSKDVFEAL